MYAIRSYYVPEHFRQEHEKPQGYKPEVLNGILSFITPYKKPLLVSLILMLIGSVASVAGPYFTKIALDEGIVNQNRIVLRNAILLYLFTALLQWIVTFIRVNIMAKAGQSAIYVITSYSIHYTKLYDRVLSRNSRPATWHHRLNSGDR